METISLLVPTLGTGWYLETTLRSAFAHRTQAKLEALVYSQFANTPQGVETEVIVKALAAEGMNVRIVAKSRRNEGVAACVNRLALAGTSDWIFYTGDDYYFLPGWDETLLRRADMGRWQYLTPRSIEPTGTNPSMYAPHDFGRTAQDFQPERLKEFWRRLPKQDVVSRWGPPFVSHRTWETVGGFDESYWPGFGTDPDFAATVYKRAREVGEPCEFLGVGDCGCYHFGCISTGRIRTPALTEHAQLRFLAKWGVSPAEFGALIGDGTPVGRREEVAIGH